MKKPRIEDFDPAAAERKLGSPLDDMPLIIKPTARQSEPNKKPSAGRTTEESETRPSDGYRASPPVKKSTLKKVASPASNSRAYVRRTFDFYEDQVAFLTKRSLEERLAGGEGSMNAMVREALDAYIREKTSK